MLLVSSQGNVSNKYGVSKIWWELLTLAEHSHTHEQFLKKYNFMILYEEIVAPFSN